MTGIYKKFALAFAVFTLVFIVGTCHFDRQEKTEPPTSDTLMIHLEKEKVKQLHSYYQYQLNNLLRSKDSVNTKFIRAQKELDRLRISSKATEIKLVQQLRQDTGTEIKDSILPLNLHYIALQNRKDSLCDAVVTNLELLGTKQDSIIGFKNKELLNLNDLNKTYELKEQALTEQLNTAYKSQRRALLKAKIFKGAAFILAGVSSAFIINQIVK